MLTLDQARAIWAARQFPGTALEELPGGWSRSLGGVDPYLALFARTGCSRADIDAALGRGALRISPAVRGCIWLIPQQDLGLALAVSEAQSRRPLLRDLAKLGCSLEQVQGLAEATSSVLHAKGACSMSALRRELSGAVTSFGEAGKKLGVSSDLPGALRLLEWEGRARRQPVGQVLDTQSYLWRPCSMTLDGPQDPIEQAKELLLRYLRWAAPASPQEFCGWSSLGKGVAAKAAKALGVVEVEVQGLGACWDWEAPKVSGPEATMLLPAQDNLQSLRGRPGSLVHPDFHDVEVHTMGSRTATIGASKWIFQRLLVRHGEIVGLWAWDGSAQKVVAAGFRGLPEDAAEAITRTEEFIRKQLAGQARAVSIDSDRAQQKRVKLVEKVAYRTPALRG